MVVAVLMVAVVLMVTVIMVTEKVVTIVRIARAYRSLKSMVDD